MPARPASIPTALASAVFGLAACNLYDPALLQQVDGNGPGDGGAGLQDGAGADAGGQGRDGSRESDADAMCEADEAGGCTRDCSVQTAGAYTYHFCPSPMTWADARLACAELQAELVQIRDLAENVLVASGLTGAAWIGLERHTQQDLWLWSANRVPVWTGGSDGSPVAERYMNWDAEQPSTPGTCGQMLASGAFQSRDCSERRPFVCVVAPDGCADDPEKTDPGQCGCGVLDVDEDEDGYAACNDACDQDPNKLTAGICGCGVPDTDLDDDGEPDCDDSCPDDPDKNAAGVCGCGVPDTDSDGDNNPDCTDGCPNDPGKVAPGVCGCGVPDTDSDGDGTPDCNDACPHDASRTLDVDSDGDGALDCNDGCPHDPSTTAACFPFTPTNFNPRPIRFGTAPQANLDGCGDGTTTLTTSSSGASFSNWCGEAPTPVVQSQNGGPSVVIIPLRGLTVGSGHTLRVIGTQPVVFAVRGNVSIAGTIDASANGTAPGAGGNASCSGSQGGDGTGTTARWSGASGGGGGGFGTAGGRGGTADTDRNGGGPKAGGAGGAVRGNGNLSPLLGGCAGGRAGGCEASGGGGGGAVQVTSSGTLRVSGTMRANGAAGATPCGANDEGGGTGGGAGGAIFLEGPTVNTTGSTLQVNGGAGGRNGSYAGVYNCGNSAGGAGSTNPSNPGGVGRDCQGGSSGGGGGYGRIRIADR
jgi:hypothetical protein